MDKPPDKTEVISRCIPDGGTTDASRHPGDEETPAPSLSPAAIAENAAHLETIVRLLRNPALTRVYVYIYYWGPVSPPEIMDALDLSKATTYNYVDTVVELGLVDRDDSNRPQQLTASPVAIVDPEHAVYITPTVLHSIALQEIDDDVIYFVERYGIGTLVAALRGTGLHFAGNATQRMVANDIDIHDHEAMMIVYALVPALAIGQQHDPYFDRLFPDIHEEIELPEDIDETEMAIIPERQGTDE
jgi:hypothetical protein